MALSRSIFSLLILSAMVKMHRYPLCAATIASPIPVFPEVPSTIVPRLQQALLLGIQNHLQSDSVLYRAPGLHLSSLTQTEDLSKPSVILFSLIRGVFPIADTKSS